MDTQVGSHKSCAIGTLLFFPNTGKISPENKNNRLTPCEASVLEAIARGKGDIVSKELLYQLVLWLSANKPQPKIVDVLVCKIRKKLGTAGGCIVTAWGRGYYLSETSVDISHSISRQGRIKTSKKWGLNRRLNDIYNEARNASE